jgi:hypothetical protein
VLAEIPMGRFVKGHGFRRAESRHHTRSRPAWTIRGTDFRRICPGARPQLTFEKQQFTDKVSPNLTWRDLWGRESRRDNTRARTATLRDLWEFERQMT